VDQYIGFLRERNWKNLALNREEWRTFFKKARANAGCRATDDDDDDMDLIHSYSSPVTLNINSTVSSIRHPRFV
jgi:hypothetical protein